MQSVCFILTTAAGFKPDLAESERSAGASLAQSQIALGAEFRHRMSRGLQLTGWHHVKLPRSDSKRIHKGVVLVITDVDVTKYNANVGKKSMYLNVQISSKYNSIHPFSSEKNVPKAHSKRETLIFRQPILPVRPEESALSLHGQQAPCRQHHRNNTTIGMTELHHRLHKHKHNTDLHYK